MAQDLPKFEGDILDIGNDYFLVKKSVVSDWANQMENLKKDVENLKIKRAPKRTGVVTGKEGRNEVLNSEQKGQILALRNKGYSLRQIAEVFGVSHETIRKAENEVKNEQVTQPKSEPISQPKKVTESNIFGTKISSDFRVKDGEQKISKNPLE